MNASEPGRSDVQASLILEFGDDSPLTHWRGVRVASYPNAKMTVTQDAYDTECAQVARQVRDLFHEGVSTMVTQIWARYETYRKADEGDAFDDDAAMQRLQDLRSSLGL